MLLNESDVIERDGERIHLSGIDDAHFYGMDNIEKAAAAISHDGFSILISHTPEVYRQAAHADFNLLLPRSMGSGAWKYHDMIGYTSVGAGSSVVPVRFNCPPEITLHRLQASS